MAKKKFKIGSVEIGEGCPVRFIADLGASHDGDLSRAIDLIQAANESGVDIVKFQHFQAASIVSKKGFDSMPKSGHQAAWAKSVFETYEEASLNSDWTSRLAAEAHSCGVEFMSTPYDFQSAELLSGFVHA